MRPGNVVTHQTITSEVPRPEAPPTRNRVPEAGQVVRVRTRTYLVGPVEKQPNGSGTLVRLACLDDDAQGMDYIRGPKDTGRSREAPLG